jgi:hypothetical protein
VWEWLCVCVCFNVIIITAVILFKWTLLFHVPHQSL